MAGERVRQPDLFPGHEPGPEEIMAKAMGFDPIAIYVGYSGGDDSLAALHWMMSNFPNCRPFSILTGIGINRTIEHRREVCARYGWDLLEIRAKEDCGQDYDAMVMKWGFPGPPLHQSFYNRLKGRAIEKLVRDEKAKLQGRKGWRRAKVLIATGIRQDESQRRMGYGGREVNFIGSQMWVNPLYWRPKSWFMDYIRDNNLPRSPVSEMLGMSGECLCGAFAHKGEKALIRIVCPDTADRLDRLEVAVRAAGHDWGWEEAPPRPLKAVSDRFQPMCVGCGKTADLFEYAAFAPAGDRP